MNCPFFHHTVVLLIDHGDQGSFGFVVNRPSDVNFSKVLSELDIDFRDEQAEKVSVLTGGPVSPDTGWVVFDPNRCDPMPSDVIRIGPKLAVTASLTMLHTLTTDTAPEKALLALGYAGWGKGQLEDEMRRGSWIPVDLDPCFVFDLPLEDRWGAALKSIGIDPAWMMGTRLSKPN